MCIVACKFFQDFGWAGIKNRDRSYKPEIVLKRSWRNNLERLLFWDLNTRWTEGVNEFGVCILSSAVAVIDDEKEGQTSKKVTSVKRRYYSPDGLRVRKGLYEKTARDALRSLIEQEIPGNTVIFDEKNCFLLEGAFPVDRDEYEYYYREILPGQIVVRTNHGIHLPYAGYQLDGDEKEQSSRKSSENRYKVALEGVKRAENPQELFDALSDTSNDDPQLNPLRIDSRQGAMRTTAQVLLVPAERCLHYRPIWCNVHFKTEADMEGKEKTYFEIVSTRKLVSFKDFIKGK